MNVTDITERQFETLVLIRTLEGFINSEYEHLEDLRGVVWNFEESLSEKEHKQYVEDICKLTEKGYLVSDAAEEHIEEDRVPEVEGITPKGKKALDEWEEGLKQEIDKGDMSVGQIINNFNHYSIFGGGLNFDINLLKGSNSLFDLFGNVIRRIGRI